MKTNSKVTNNAGNVSARADAQPGNTSAGNGAKPTGDQASAYKNTEEEQWSPMFQVDQICSHSPEEVESGQFEVNYASLDANGILLNDCFGTSDLAEETYRPVYDALLRKRNDDSAAFEALSREGKALLEVVERAGRLAKAMSLQQFAFENITESLTDVHDSAPEKYPDSPCAKINGVAFEQLLPPRIPDYELRVWLAMPRKVFKRLFVGILAATSGGEYTGNWSQEEMQCIRTASFYPTMIAPAIEDTRKQMLDAKADYLAYVSRQGGERK